MPNVDIHTLTINRACTMTVEVGTNCPQGGDRGHGGRTLLRICGHSGADLYVKTDEGEKVAVRAVEITLAGDAEAKSFVDALEFALLTLRRQFSDVGPSGREEEVE